MSGLIAFTGPPDDRLAERMLGCLSHRGQPLGPSLVTSYGSVAVCEWPDFLNDAPGQVSTGTYKTPVGNWALSGFTLTEFPPPNANAVASLRGSFSVACLADGTLSIARDPTGCQSLYYGRAGARWLVATEPKAITSQVEFVKQIRPSSIAQYLAFSFVPGANTMLEHLFEAEAGHTITFKGAQPPQQKRYFVFEEQECEADSVAAGSDQEWADATRRCIGEAVRERLGNHSSTALFLSGGLDSSIVASELAAQSKRQVQTFAIHFGKRYPNELPFAKAVADQLGTEHHEIQIRPRQFLPRMRQMIWHLDEPIGDPITQPNYELASIVGRDFRFVFNGEGGDPLFGGPKNIPMMLSHWYGGLPRSDNFRQQAYLASYRRAYEECSRLLSREILEQIDPTRDLEEPLSQFFNIDRPRQFLNKLMAINIRFKGANLILPKVDRMLAAHGLTPLSPLFDDQLTNLSFRMPTRLKLRSGIEKYVLKLAYRDRLPQTVIDRPKSGMRVPVHFWFQRELRGYARDILSRRNITQAGIFDPDRVQQLLRYETEEGPGRYGLRLWMLLTFETWRRLVVEGESP